MPTNEYIVPKGSKNNNQCPLYWASQVMLVVKNLLANAGDRRDAGSIPGLGRAPGGGHVNTLQYSCLENSMDRGAWWSTARRVAENPTVGPIILLGKKEFF